MPANIAEGCGRESERELARLLSIAAGSAGETEYHLILAHDLGYFNAENYAEFDGLINEVKRMLNSLIRKLKANM